MKVELNGLAATQAAVERSTRQVSSSSTAPAEGVTADRTTFKSGSASVQSLVSQALATPDVRQNRIDAITQAISSGTYKIDADKLASALVADGKQ